MQYRKGRKCPWMVQVRDRVGKVKTASFATKEAAELFEKKEKEKTRLERKGIRSPREEILFIDFARSWISKRMQKISSAPDDERRLRQYWLPKFGDILLVQISTSDILAELDRIQFELGHTPADRNRHRSLLHKLFNDAILEDKCDLNPVSRITLEYEETEQRKISRPRKKLSDSEQELYICGLYSENIQYGILGNLLLWTGARICSCNVIQYQDVDFESEIIWIRRIEERRTGEVKSRQKGRKKRRFHEHKVPLFPKLKQALLSHMQKSSYVKPTDYIACTKEGSFIPYDTFKDVHARAIKATGISRITPHDIRRTFATNCKKAGFTRTEIKEMLDHSTELMGDLYDLNDIDHLVEKGKRLGFGANDLIPNLINLRG